LVFKVDPAGNESVFYNFTEEEVQPALSASSLLLDPAGNLYGATLYGGSISEGTIFEISSQGVYTMLHSFDFTDGAYPASGLVRDNAGNLYGSTSGGGNTGCSSGCGVIFKITP
ncbi:MAG TPA: choice-of-anchor tandem repeat GloVer-containing protein, partial [Terracidiphilus sp.]